MSLGPKEMRDAKQVLDFLRSYFKMSSVYLWGRSMGAVAGILLAEKYPGALQGLVLDSPFSDISVMVG